MEIIKIPYSKTNYFSELTLDYINKNNNLEYFINRFPDLDSFGEQIKEKTKQQINRELLVSVLERQNSQIELSNSSLNNIKLLKDSRTFSITTGHQICLFTGPLYFIFKIISAINLTEQLSKKYPENNFVPILWMASEDHDLEEVNHVNIFGKKIQWNNNSTGAVGRMSLEGITKCIEEMEDILNLGEKKSNIINIFKESYLHSNNLSEATRRLVNALFGKYGLVIIDADEKELKRTFTSVIKKDVIYKGFVNTIRETNKMLHESYSVQAFVRDVNFFMLSDNNRTLIKTNIEESLIEKEPNLFSPNVLLRPLYQECILPNIGVVGGQSEIAYWLQLKSSFEQEQIPFPILVLRNSAMILRKKLLNRIRSFNFNLSDIFLNEDLLHAKYVKSINKDSLSLINEKENIKKIYFSIISRVKDQSLETSIKADLKKHLNSLEKMELKIVRLEKRRNEDVVRQISKIKKQLFPNNTLQERHSNFSEFYLDFGDNFIEILKNNLNPLDSNFVVLSY